jgi:hypothetical protein
MKVKQIKTTACTTRFDVDGETVELWIITGGTPALDFVPSYGFTERFPAVPKWGNDHWLGVSDGGDPAKFGPSRYSFQNPDDIRGPGFEVLPDGIRTLKAWFEKNKPLKDLRDKRYAEIVAIIGGTDLLSRRLHSERNRSYFKCQFEPYNCNSVPSVLLKTGNYRYADKKDMAEKAPEAWNELEALMESINCKDRKYQFKGWQDLTEAQFAEVKKALQNVVSGQSGECFTCGGKCGGGKCPNAARFA